MGLRGVVEFALHINKFINIDLFQQGLYQLRFKISFEDSSYKYYAAPYIIQTNLSNKQKPSPVQLTVPYFKESTSEYLTRLFLIRYCEEENDINEICFFRIEFSDKHSIVSQILHLEVDLLFSDISAIGGWDGLQFHLDELSALVEMKVVSSLKYNLSGFLLGEMCGFQLIFDNIYCCRVDAAVYSILSNYKFYQAPLHFNKQDEVIRVVSKIEKKVLSPSMTFKTFADYLTNTFNGGEFNKEVAFNFFKDYSSNLKYSYEKLKSKYSKLFQEIYQKEPLNIDEEKIEIKEDDMNSLQTYIPMFEKTINILATNQYKLWSLIIELVKQQPAKTMLYEIQEYAVMASDRWNEYVFCEKINSSKFSIAMQRNTIEQHTKISKEKRAQIKGTFIPLPIESTKFLDKLTKIPIVIQEIYVKDAKPSESIEKSRENEKEIVKEKGKYKQKVLHLFVLVHGYQGNSNDLRLIKSYITLCYPNSKFLCSNKNENDTKSSIIDMGRILATEVKDYIKEEFNNEMPTKLSFIGHSLGGVIIRAALPHLHEYKGIMNTFMTLSSPHLGLMYNTNSLVSTGVWFMKTFSTTRSLQQLSLNDDPIIENTALYKISLNEGLEWFKYVVFASSHNDFYSPFESARIELNDKVFKDKVKGKAYIQMSDNILSRITAKSVYKLDVDFKIDKKQLDKMIGRAAHIEFLDDEFWIQIVVSKMPELFE